MSDLKPCPIPTCEKPPYEDDAGHVCCFEPGCLLSGHEFSVATWQGLPRRTDPVIPARVWVKVVDKNYETVVSGAVRVSTEAEGCGVWCDVEGVPDQEKVPSCGTCYFRSFDANDGDCCRCVEWSKWKARVPQPKECKECKVHLAQNLGLEAACKTYRAKITALERDMLMRGYDSTSCPGCAAWERAFKILRREKP